MQFPHSAIPLKFQEDEQTASFMEDLLTVMSNLYLLAEGIGWYVGNGSPEGRISARVGSLYSRKDGGVNTTLYVKTSGTGNTGWTAK